MTESAFMRLEVALNFLGIIYYEVVTGLVAGRWRRAVFEPGPGLVFFIFGSKNR